MTASSTSQKAFSRSVYLSQLYGTLLSLVGIVVPMTEALRGNWISNHLVALFLAYLYALSAIFVVYLIIREMILRNRHNKLRESRQSTNSNFQLFSVTDQTMFDPNNKKLYNNVGNRKRDSLTGQNEDNGDQQGIDGDEKVYRVNDQISHSLEQPPRKENQEEPRRDDEMPQKDDGQYNEVFLEDDEDTTDRKPREDSLSSSSASAFASTSTDYGKDNRFNPSPQDTGGDPPKTVYFETNRDVFSVSDQGLEELRQRHLSFTSSMSPDEDTADAIHDYFEEHLDHTILADEESTIFLKGGVLMFAIANIVYISLIIQDSHQEKSKCNEDVIIYPHYMHLVFIVTQTYILLKRCRYSLRANKVLARFGLAHLVSTNICIWLRFLMLEATEAIEKQEHMDEGDGHTTPLNTSDANFTECTTDTLMKTAGPYLFPFVLEYSLVAMSSFVFMFNSIQFRVSKALYKSVRNAITKSSGDPAHGLREDVVPSMQHNERSVEDDKHTKSHTGLFLGVLFLAGTVISIILFFYNAGIDETETANLVYATADSIMVMIMLVVALFGVHKLSTFDVNMDKANSFDHILLMLSSAFYIVLGMFEAVSAVYYITEVNKGTEDIMMFISATLSVFQCIVQTIFILDGMRREATSDEQRTKKPGRNVITFMLVANVAAWVFLSFQNTQVYWQAGYDFYGSVAWAIIQSVAFPAVLFFKFHSSICLAHMWHSCYEVHENTLVENKVFV